MQPAISPILERPQRERKPKARRWIRAFLAVVALASIAAGCTHEVIFLDGAGGDVEDVEDGAVGDVEDVEDVEDGDEGDEGDEGGGDGG